MTPFDDDLPPRRFDEWGAGRPTRTVPPREESESLLLAQLVEEGLVVPRAVACGGCGTSMVLSARIEREFGKYSLSYRCSECRATHGAHADGEPLGIPGDAETRAARKKAHAAFDGLWRGAAAIYDDLPEDPREKVAAIRRLENVARSRAYEWLAERMRLPEDEAHIGKFDALTCELVVLLVRGVGPYQVREWAKARPGASK